MLSELRNVRQVPGDRRRRWFSDEKLEVVVWYEPDGTIFGFQLCYDLRDTPRALTWTREAGFSHCRVDDGEESVFSNRTPMLRSGGVYDAVLVRTEFLAAAESMPEAERRFVEAKLAESVQAS